MLSAPLPFPAILNRLHIRCYKRSPFGILICGEKVIVKNLLPHSIIDRAPMFSCGNIFV